jgi:hypothetical protein
LTIISQMSEMFIRRILLGVFFHFWENVQVIGIL